MDKQQQTTIERIAREHLGILCLETRNHDGLDFYDISVWGAKAALEAAYNAGRLHEINLQKKG